MPTLTRSVVHEWIEPTKKFSKSVRRLDTRIVQELEAVFDELMSTDELPPGRRYKKVFDNQMRSVRLNRQFRFVFEMLSNDAARPVAVGPHDEAYDDAERWWKNAVKAQSERQ